MRILCGKQLVNGGICLREVGHSGIHTKRVFTCAGCAKIKVGQPYSYYRDDPDASLCFPCTKVMEDGDLMRDLASAQDEQDEMDALDAKLRERPRRKIDEK